MNQINLNKLNIALINLDIIIKRNNIKKHSVIKKHDNWNNNKLTKIVREQTLINNLFTR